MTENDSTKELTGKEKRLANLKPFARTGEPKTPEEEQRQKEISILGGKARGAQMKKAKNLRELANDLLECRISRERAQNILGDLANDIPEEDLTNGAVLLARMLNEVNENGTVKAAEYLRDTSGQKPKEVIESNINVTTDADRELMAKLNSKLSKMVEGD